MEKMTKLVHIFVGFISFTLILTFVKVYTWHNSVFPYEKRVLSGTFFGRMDRMMDCLVRPVTENSLVTYRGQTSIPKIIHQIWNEEIVPRELVSNIQGLVRDNPSPEWKYYFWTKESGLKFIKEKYPYLYDRANNINSLQRSDMLRYLVIYEYGGIYFDLDTVSVRPLREFAETHICSLTQEPAEHFFTLAGRNFLLTNAALFCVRKHPFYTNVVLRLTTVLKDTCKDAFTCTGPHVVTSTYQELNKTNNYAGHLPDIQPSEVFQDVYDHKLQWHRLENNCYNNSKLLPYQVKLCANWISRGKEKRNLSDQALTYHTWFHTHNKKLTRNTSDHVKNIVPHAKIYGKDF